MPRDHAHIARSITALEGGHGDERAAEQIRAARSRAGKPQPAPVIGITGTGGAGKSSLTDELLQRFVRHFPDRADRGGRDGSDAAPLRRRAARRPHPHELRWRADASSCARWRRAAQHLATSAVLADVIDLYNARGLRPDLVETAGIGQSDTEIVDLVDLSLYVMTSEYGAASQLEKIDMLDFADLIVLNKFEKRGAEDALRDVRKQWRRNHPERFETAGRGAAGYPDHRQPLQRSGRQSRCSLRCCAGARSARAIGRRTGPRTRAGAACWAPPSSLARPADSGRAHPLPGGDRRRRAAHARARSSRRVDSARRAYGLYGRSQRLQMRRCPRRSIATPRPRTGDATPMRRACALRARLQRRRSTRSAPRASRLLKAWPARAQAAAGRDLQLSRCAAAKCAGENYTESLEPQPRAEARGRRASQDWGELLRFLGTENLPGAYPYTGGVYPYRREDEDPTRMFAGEGPPERTNRRFHYLARGHAATRLSTAFDSTTLYGEDPDERPDIYGRTGNSASRSRRSMT